MLWRHLDRNAPDRHDVLPAMPTICSSSPWRGARVSSWAAAVHDVSYVRYQVTFQAVVCLSDASRRPAHNTRTSNHAVSADVWRAHVDATAVNLWSVVPQTISRPS